MITANVAICATEELNFKFDFILLNFFNLYGHILLVAAVLDSGCTDYNNYRGIDSIYYISM